MNLDRTCDLVLLVFPGTEKVAEGDLILPLALRGNFLLGARLSPPASRKASSKVPIRAEQDARRRLSRQLLHFAFAFAHMKIT